MDKLELKNKIYYYIIALGSILFLVFVPMLGSEAGLRIELPNSLAGWSIFVITKIAVAALNVMIFHCFLQQAQVNVQDNPNYIEAKKILMKITDEKYVPRSPEYFLSHQYKTKGITIAITSIVACISLTNAIMTFDPVAFMTYLFTVAVAVIMGILTMKNNEVYWTTEFYQYALYKKGEFNGNQQDKCGEQIYYNPRQCTFTNDNCGQSGV